MARTNHAEEDDLAETRDPHSGQRRACSQDRAAKISVESDAIILERRTGETLHDERPDRVHQGVERTVALHRIDERGVHVLRIVEEIDS